MASSTRINFADVSDQKEFDVLPTGTYTARISNLVERQAGDTSQNAGARILRWEFEVINNESYNNRKVWDNQICIESAMWKIKAMLTALEVPVDTVTYDDENQTFYYKDDDNSEQELDMEDLVGGVLDIKVGIRPARKDPNTGRDYDKQNRVNAFYVHEASDDELMA